MIFKKKKKLKLIKITCPGCNGEGKSILGNCAGCCGEGFRLVNRVRFTKRLILIEKQ